MDPPIPDLFRQSLSSLTYTLNRRGDKTPSHGGRRPRCIADNFLWVGRDPGMTDVSRGRLTVLAYSAGSFNFGDTQLDRSSDTLPYEKCVK